MHSTRLIPIRQFASSFLHLFAVGFVPTRRIGTIAPHINLVRATTAGIAILFCLAGAVAEAQEPTPFWSLGMGSADIDAANAVATDGSGGIVVTGNFRDSVDFGGGNLISAGSSDIFVAKYDANGAHVWSQNFGGTLSDFGHAIAVDDLGNVVVAGLFQLTADFGGGNLVSAGGTDVFVAKYDVTGAHVWSQRFGDTSDDAGYAVAVDGAGNVLVAGDFRGTVDFGGGNLVSAGGTDIFLAKYNTLGAHQWSQRFGSTSDDEANGLALDASGGPALTGGFRGTVDFGGGGLTSGATQDIFLATYDASGSHQWSQHYGDFGVPNRGEAVAVDGSNNVVMTGVYAGTVDFGGGNLTSAGDNEIFLAKYDASGSHQWSQRFGSSAVDRGYSVGVDGSDNVIFTGEFGDTVNFGGGTLQTAGVFDIFLAKFDEAGIHQWSQRFGGASADAGNGVAVDASGAVVMTGQFQASADFGTGILTSAGSTDIVLAKYGPNPAEPAIVSIEDILNDQGRSVKIRFRQSGHDASTPTPVLQYEAYLRDDPLPSGVTEAVTPSGAPISDASFLSDDWIYMTSVSAHQQDEYLMISPTLADSTPADGQHFSVFFIRAATSNPGVFFDSQPDSGYSLDNLVPAVPGNLVYNSGALTWDPSTAADFDYFTVYGSNTNSFGAATLVDYTITTAMDVSASPYPYYFVTATDFSGNESEPAELDEPTGADDTPSSYVLSVSAYPNPFNPRTTVRYTVPHEGTVRVRVYDASGALVTTLIDAVKSAGAYTTSWNGENDSGRRVSSGVYFARVSLGGETRSYKMVVVK